jgi:hypothetical protein
MSEPKRCLVCGKTGLWCECSAFDEYIREEREMIMDEELQKIWNDPDM